MPSELLLLVPLFFVIATCYSAAGFGGGSSYLAVLALVPSLAFEEIKILALICNIIVVSGSVLIFYKNGLIHFKRVWPLIVLSVPFAYLGGRMCLDETLFFVLLACTLLAASLLMLLSKPPASRQLPNYINSIIGSGIGFLSGMVGIGGGIFLSPILYLSKWGSAKLIAACTALFILVNSIAGLTGQLMTNEISLNISFVCSLGLAVFVGGQLGARLTTIKLNAQKVKTITALLILLVALRLLYKYAWLVWLN